MLIEKFKSITKDNKDTIEKYFYNSVGSEKIKKLQIRNILESVDVLIKHLKVIKNIEPDNASFMEEIINKIEGTYNKWKEELKDDLENIFDPEDILRRDSNGN